MGIQNNKPCPFIYLEMTCVVYWVVQEISANYIKKYFIILTLASLIFFIINYIIITVI